MTITVTYTKGGATTVLEIGDDKDIGAVLEAVRARMFPEVKKSELVPPPQKREVVDEVREEEPHGVQGRGVAPKRQAIRRGREGDSGGVPAVRDGLF